MDLLDAVRFDLRGHVEARLYEEAASVNKRDRSMVGAAALGSVGEDQDIDGLADEAPCEELVRFLLQKHRPKLVTGEASEAALVATGATRGTSTEGHSISD